MGIPFFTYADNDPAQARPRVPGWPRTVTVSIKDEEQPERNLQAVLRLVYPHLFFFFGFLFYGLAGSATGAIQILPVPR